MSSFLRKAASKIRGILGLGVIGAGIGFLVTATFGLIALPLEHGFSFELAHWVMILGEMAEGVVPWTLMGGFTGLGLGALIATTGARRRLEELPLWQMALFGALAGALFIPAYYMVVGGWRDSLLPFVGVTGAIGAVLSTSMVALAKRAHRRELSAVEEVQALLESELAVAAESADESKLMSSARGTDP